VAVGLVGQQEGQVRWDSSGTGSWNPDGGVGLAGNCGNGFDGTGGGMKGGKTVGVGLVEQGREWDYRNGSRSESRGKVRAWTGGKAVGSGVLVQQLE
jgi:hypothetical protein